MKITFAPSDRGMNGQRVSIDSMAQYIARAWIAEHSPIYAGEVMDVRIRYAAYGEEPDEIVVSPWDREQGLRTAPDCAVFIDRLHIY